MANQFKFVGLDNSTTGGALTPFGSGNPLIRVKLKNKSIEKKLFRNPSLHFGEGYMNQEIIIKTFLYLNLKKKIFLTRLSIKQR